MLFDLAKPGGSSTAKSKDNFYTPIIENLYRHLIYLQKHNTKGDLLCLLRLRHPILLRMAS